MPAIDKSRQRIRVIRTGRDIREVASYRILLAVGVGHTGQHLYCISARQILLRVEVGIIADQERGLYGAVDSDLTIRTIAISRRYRRAGLDSRGMKSLHCS